MPSRGLPNRRAAGLALSVLLLAALSAAGARAEPRTVCTITVNSADERETLRRHLPADEYRFVELVERGRPEWLASACRQGVRCDVLVISGHFDDGDEFYSDRLDAREHLPVAEMERVACSDSCPGLFAQLKEVYLFGCNTLDARPRRTATAEVARSLARAGHSAADAERIVRELDLRTGESNRDRMRAIFRDTPVIYGFSGKAPLGSVAGPLLERYFRTAPGGEIGSGSASPTLKALFAPSSMTVVSGLGGNEPQAAFRQDVCHFSDERLAPAQKLAFVHRLLARDMAEVRMLLDHVERYVNALGDDERLASAAARELDAIARDDAARTRYLDFARDADDPAVRVRMVDLARSLGWLTADAQRAELIRVFDERIAAGAAGPVDVGLACTRNADGELDGAWRQLRPHADGVTDAAIRACLGSEDARAQVLHAFTGGSDAAVEVAQVYLHHRPIAKVGELRTVTAGIARMDAAPAQVRALGALAGLRLSDPQSLDALARLFPATRSVSVQRAIAGVLLRADYPAAARTGLAHALRASRLKSPDGEDLIDVLIRRLLAS